MIGVEELNQLVIDFAEDHPSALEWALKHDIDPIALDEFLLRPLQVLREKSLTISVRELHGTMYEMIFTVLSFGWDMHERFGNATPQD